MVEGAEQEQIERLRRADRRRNPPGIGIKQPMRISLASLHRLATVARGWRQTPKNRAPKLPERAMGAAVQRQRSHRLGSRSAKRNGPLEDGLIHGKAITKEYGYLQTAKRLQGFPSRAAIQMRGAMATAASSSIPRSRPARRMFRRVCSSKSTPPLNHHTGGLYGDGRHGLPGLRRRTNTCCASRIGTSIC